MVDEMSHGTGIRSMSACRASQASDHRDVSRKPILVMRVSRDPSTCSSWPRVTMVELLAARFTKYHSSLVIWSFLCPGLARDIATQRLMIRLCATSVLSSIITLMKSSWLITSRTWAL
jgi:hypothetical protein